uniref:Uncharacterized protein n=1 Tax=Arundo donax TaxID=35708 RepID=A0A0A9QY72_ARUDO
MKLFPKSQRVLSLLELILFRPSLLTTHWKIPWIVWKFSRTSWSFFLTFADSSTKAVVCTS